MVDVVAFDPRTFDVKRIKAFVHSATCGREGKTRFTLHIHWDPGVQATVVLAVIQALYVCLYKRKRRATRMTMGLDRLADKPANLNHMHSVHPVERRSRRAALLEFQRNCNPHD